MWKDPHAIVDECIILVADRICRGKHPVPEWLEKHIKLVTVPLIEISSSEIRQALKEGRSIRYLVPEPVLDVIKKYGDLE